MVLHAAQKLNNPPKSPSRTRRSARLQSTPFSPLQTARTPSLTTTISSTIYPLPLSSASQSSLLPPPLSVSPNPLTASSTSTLHSIPLPSLPSLPSLLSLSPQSYLPPLPISSTIAGLSPTRRETSSAPLLFAYSSQVPASLSPTFPTLGQQVTSNLVPPFAEYDATADLRKKRTVELSETAVDQSSVSYGAQEDIEMKDASTETMMNVEQMEERNGKCARESGDPKMTRFDETESVRSECEGDEDPDPTYVPEEQEYPEEVEEEGEREKLRGELLETLPPVTSASSTSSPAPPPTPLPTPLSTPLPSSSSSAKLPSLPEWSNLSGVDLHEFLIANAPTPEIAAHHRRLPAAVAADRPQPERQQEEAERMAQHVEEIKKVFAAKGIKLDDANLSLPVGSVHAVKGSNWNYPVPNDEGAQSIWNPKGSRTFGEVSRVHGYPDNGSYISDFHLFPSENQRSKDDGATAEEPFLSSSVVDAETAKILLHTLESPFYIENTLIRALPPPGEIKSTDVHGKDMAVQVLKVLKTDLPEYARSSDRSVAIKKHVYNVPFSGVHLEASKDGKKKARDVEGGTAPLEIVYVIEQETGEALSSFFLLNHLSYYLYAGVLAFGSANVVQAVHAQFGDLARIPNGYSPIGSSSVGHLTSSHSSKSSHAFPPELLITSFVPVPATSSFFPFLSSSTLTKRLSLLTIAKFDDRSPEEQHAARVRAGQKAEQTRLKKLDEGKSFDEVYGISKKKKNKAIAQSEGRDYDVEIKNKTKESRKKNRDEKRMIIESNRNRPIAPRPTPRPIAPQPAARPLASTPLARPLAPVSSPLLAPTAAQSQMARILQQRREDSHSSAAVVDIVQKAPAKKRRLASS